MHYQDTMKASYLHEVTENMEILQKKKNEKSFLINR